MSPETHTYPDGASIGVLYHDDGTVDEVVSRGCLVHSEQMDDDRDWIAYYAPDESERFVVSTYAVKGRRLEKRGHWEGL